MHHYFWLADKSPGTALADFPEARLNEALAADAIACSVSAV